MVKRLDAALEPSARGVVSPFLLEAGVAVAVIALLVLAELHLDGAPGLAVRAAVVVALGRLSPPHGGSVSARGWSAPAAERIRVDGESLADRVRDAEADVVLLDLSMPRVDGLEALAELRADDPGLGIVVLSGFEPTRMAAKALALGADRYLEKAAGMEDVRATVRAVAAGRRGPGALLEAVA